MGFRKLASAAIALVKSSFSIAAAAFGSALSSAAIRAFSWGSISAPPEARVPSHFSFLRMFAARLKAVSRSVPSFDEPLKRLDPRQEAHKVVFTTTRENRIDQVVPNPR